MSDIIIELKNLQYFYPDGHLALDDINLKVRKDEKVAIVGPNGAGKSTLLMLINGLFKPSQGSVHILGNLIDRNHPKTKLRLGLVFQNPDDQLFCPTLWDDVTFGLLNMGLDEDEVIQRAQEALKTVGLDGYGERAPHHLSAGEKKKAAIATVYAMRPEILMLDEPTANLDPKGKTELIRIIDTLYGSNNLTLIIATHDVDLIPLVADKINILNKGRIIAEGNLELLSDFKIMDEIGLEPPSITRLFKLLNQSIGTDVINPLPLTIEQALQQIKIYLKSNILSRHRINK